MYVYLKLGFQTPEDATAGRRDFCRRWSDSRKKPMLTPPRMTTPEIKALVTGFAAWRVSADAEKDSVNKSRNIKHTCCFTWAFTCPEFALISLKNRWLTFQLLTWVSCFQEYLLSVYSNMRPSLFHNSVYFEILM